MDTWTYNFEYTRRLRWAHVGCGDHSYRNILPAFRYCPIDLMHVCDLRENRAAEFARIFGAAQAGTSYRDVLDDDRIEVVSLVMGVDRHARVVYPDLAVQALQAGKHVWIEKPPANDLDEVRRIKEAEQASGKRVFCGFKKMFFPSVMRAASIISSTDFGQPVQFTGRYPQEVPTEKQMQDDPASLVGFLDHLCHPTSIALRLVGPIDQVMYIRESRHGGAMMLLRFASGAVGHLHLCAGMGWSGPMERIEVVGSDGGHIVIDNHVDVHWYRRSSPKLYGRWPDFTSEPDQAALHWQPEFSLGVLYNNGLFLLGYAIELQTFCDALLNETPLPCAGSDDIAHLTAVYQAIISGREGEWISIPSL